MTLSVTNQFQRKQVIESAKVNTNFNEVVDYVNNLEIATGNGTAILNNAITTDKIADNAVTNAKLTDDCVTSVELRDDASVDANRSVTTDHIRDSAITAAKIATAVAGNGLSGGGGTALAVNVDNSTIEISTDTLQLKDGGTTEAKLASAVTTKLGQNIGLIAKVLTTTTSTSYVTVASYTGQGRLIGVGCSVNNSTVRITVDGVLYNEVTTFGSPGQVQFAGADSSDMFMASATDTTALDKLRLNFKTSFLVEGKTLSGTSTDFRVVYERQA